MPPKVRFAKEDIIRAAVDVVREGGISMLNARGIAEKLGCSTQPLYRELRNMEEIRMAVTARAQQLFDAAILHSLSLSTTPYKSSGVAFLRFAHEEKELFKLLFMCDRTAEQQRIAETSDPSMLYVIEALMKTNGFTRQQAEAFHRNNYVFIYGLCVMIATNYIPYDEQAYSNALTEQFQAHRLLLEQVRV